jgi:hypothetical protein
MAMPMMATCWQSALYLGSGDLAPARERPSSLLLLFRLICYYFFGNEFN